MVKDTTTSEGRPQFWACKFCRLLADKGIANQIGYDGTYMLTVIVHKEDEMRYAGRVSFWVEQLIAACGFKNESKLKRVRKKVVGAGWLEYEPGRKGRAAQYRVLVPKAYSEAVSSPTFRGTSDPEFTESHELSGALVTHKTPLSGSPVNQKADDIHTYTLKPKKRGDKSPRVFKKPSVDEVKQYVTENSYHVDAEEFVDHYTSNGWSVGRAKMKDWQATVRKWNRRAAERSAGRLPEIKYKEIT